MREPDVVYKGWELRWTGWKGPGNRHPFHDHGEKEFCTICEKQLATGEEVVGTFASDLLHHFACRTERWNLTAQWLAYFAIDGQLRKCIYSSAPGSSGPYRRGEMFSIEPVGDQPIIVEETPESVKDKAKADALALIQRLIDEEEARPSGFWDRVA